MKIRILKYILISLTLIAAFLAWQSIDRAVNVTDSSKWFAPIAFFSGLSILLYLDIILIRRMLLLGALLAGVFLLDLIFTINSFHIIATLLAYLLSVWSMVRIKRDLRLNVKISLWKSIRSGSVLMLVAFSMMIASQYYVEIKKMDSQRLIPQFNISEMTGSLTSKFLAAMNPDFKVLEQDGLTVDELILQIQKNQNEEFSGTANANEQLNQLILQEGRKKFSEIAGMPLIGQEKVSDVLSNVVNQRIDRYLGSGLADSQKSSPLPFIMAIVLFLTIVPLGSVLSKLWIIVIGIIIWIFIKSGLIHIAKIPVEMEIIEQE